MIEQIRFPLRKALKIAILQPSAIPTAIRSLGLQGNQPVMVLIGGAGGISKAVVSSIQATLKLIAGAAEQHGATIVDGGTQSGIMATIGKIRTEGGFGFPLIGVAAEGTVTWPGRKHRMGKKLFRRKNLESLDPNHSHFILVPGKNWGDESIWITEVATQLAGHKPSIAILINGGQIAREQDIPNHIKAGRPVLVIEGTGRAADEFATIPLDTELLKFIHVSELDRLPEKLGQYFEITP